MTTKRTNWLISLTILFLFVMIFLPAQVASPRIQTIIVAVVGVFALAFQVLLLRTTKEKTQSYILLGLTLIAMALMFLVYR
ncbi:hypothetical protein [Jiulongibacter sediminis]|uniref:hypothetical protein n=1 Tax=Jiulongibacter sediminis TaxID=1605367 RepID=UPI0026ECB2B4|nr:hypothetical protein [Jiulongibacter sediminis]